MDRLAFLALVGFLMAAAPPAHGAIRSSRACAAVQLVAGQKRQVCLVYKASGGLPRSSPRIRVAYKHLTLSWSFRCPKGARSGTLGIVVGQYRGARRIGGDSGLGTVAIQNTVAGSGFARLDTRRATAIEVSASTVPERVPLGACTWHVTVTGDNY